MKNTHNLMKHFASMLRKTAMGKDTGPSQIDEGLLKYLTRKELIAILSNKFDKDQLAKLNLKEAENEELLELIGDELFVLAYFAEQWCKDAVQVETVVSTEQNPKTPVKPKKKGVARAN